MALIGFEGFDNVGTGNSTFTNGMVLKPFGTGFSGAWAFNSGCGRKAA